MQRITADATHALYTIAHTRQMEQQAAATLPPHTLMQRAGLATANLAQALAPHARVIWVACGPGNNGGDGLEAAAHLCKRGYRPVVTWLGESGRVPADAQASWARATQAGVAFATEPPPQTDLCIDALLGIGSTRAPEGLMATWIQLMNQCTAPVLAVDLPTGLQADTGSAADCCVQAHHTLSLLTLKPGLFTAGGRDAAGQVWIDTLGAAPPAPLPDATLAGPPPLLLLKRLHASHKGMRGDVAIVGGATGMTGAALLAASAALHAGAGRIMVSLLDNTPLVMDPQQPELMMRPLQQLALHTTTVVCGCGGGDAVSAVLPDLLQQAYRLVLDADALNAIAADTTLQALLLNRGPAFQTILTPHPLEAARLLGCTTTQVQSDRLMAAQQLAERMQCTVVLKGSGSITATPGQTPVINPTGSGLLATGGTGDVLAGLVGARLAEGCSAFEAAWSAAYQHGLLADHWPGGAALTAGRLARALH